MNNLVKSIKLTFIFCILFIFGYVIILWLFAQLAAPNKGNVAIVSVNGKTVGAPHIGQVFTKDIYFWGRPSNAGSGYDATKSGGSNCGPTNKKYLSEVEKRISVFLKYHPYLTRKDIPAEMVTASGSGLDPDISPKSALIQVKRIAKARGIDQKAILALVQKNIEKPLLGVLGTEKVNVLKLNILLNQLYKCKSNQHLPPEK